ncbi:urease isoform X1 [Tanacetum coccineum]|uniref:Urease isoform X1 n=1 Tax=Tanacetum coccineum TaxID=301880 RepID=A0ABQ5J2E3_9ASTR
MSRVGFQEEDAHTFDNFIKVYDNVFEDDILDFANVEVEVLGYEDWRGAVADINEDGFCVLSKVYATFIIFKNLMSWMLGHKSYIFYLIYKRQVLPTILQLLDSVLVKGTFPDGDAKSVTLVRIGGNQVIRWGNAIADNFVNEANVKTVIESVHARGFGNSKDTSTSHVRQTFVCGYRIVAEVEKDFVVYGDECVFGGGKVIKDGMGQSSRYSVSDCLDTVIAGEGKMVIAGAIDCHVHFICPQLAYEAIASGKRYHDNGGVRLKLHEEGGTTPAVI